MPPLLIYLNAKRGRGRSPRRFSAGRAGRRPLYEVSNMYDIIFLGVMLLFFVVSIGYVRACDRL